jgi:hypothetical protein
VARPRFNPTAEQRKMVGVMTGYGIPEVAIARTLSIDAKTLRKHFRKELDLAATKANATVAQSAFRMASSGQHPAMTIFWLKCRAGWRETQVVQHKGADGGSVEVSYEHMQQRITDELGRLAAAGGMGGIPGQVHSTREVGAGVLMEGVAGADQPTGTDQ